MDTDPKVFRGHRKTIIILSVIFTSLLAAGVYSYYEYERSSRFDQYSISLKAVSGLKNDDITQWLAERKAEVDFFSSDINIIGNTKQILRLPSADLKKSFYDNLHTTKENHSYDDIFIVSLTGDVLFSFKENFKKTDSESQKYITTAANNKSILFRELYYSNEDGKIHLDIVSPLINKNTVIAAMVFRINPANSFYPLLLKWPVSSKTSESYIVKKEQNRVVYFSELKFYKNAPLNLKVPLVNKERTAVQAALGKTGIAEGYDYRDEEVLSIINPVKGTDWILITKTDNSEIYAEVWNKTLLVSGLAITLILFFISGLSMAYELEEKKMKLNILAKERDLKETQNEFRTTLYSIGDAVITTDSSGKIQHMNSVAENLTGWKENKAAGRKLEEVFTLVYESNNISVPGIFERIFNSGDSFSIFTEPVFLKSKSGKLIPISDSGSPIKDEEGNISGVVIVFRDQTTARETESNLRNSEERYRMLFNNHHTIMLLIDPAGGEIIDANPAACNFYGYKKEEFTRLKIFDLNLLPPKETDQKMKIAKQGESQTFQFKHKLASGQVKDVEVYSSPVILEKKQFLFSIIHDISLRKETEEALKTSEEKFSKAFKTSPNSISINRLTDGLFYEINTGFTETFGYTWEELEGKTTISMGIWANPEDRKELINILKRDGEARNVKVVFRRKDGQLRDGLISAKILRLADEDCILTSIRDITEQKRAEEALKASEDKFFKAFKTSPEAISITRMSDGTFYEINDGFTNLYGYTWDELKGNTSLGLSFWPYPEERQIIINQLIKNGEVKDVECTLRRKDGTLRQISVSAKRINIGGEDCLLSTVHDVTERNKAEEALRLSEDKFSKAFKTSPDAISINKAKDGIFLEINDGFTEIFGYIDEEVIGKSSIELGVWKYPEDREIFTKEIDEKGEAKNLEFKFKSKSGKIIIGLISGRRISINGEDCLLIAMRDVTEIKKAQEALRISEDKFSKAFKTSPDSININRLYDGMYIEINEGFTNITGYTWDDVAGKTSYEVGVWADEGTRLKVVKSLITKGEINNLETRFRLKNGEIRTGLLSARKIFIDNQECILSIVRDITERKEAEEALLASEEKFSLAFKTSPDSISINRLSDGLYLDVNESFTEVTGYSLEDVSGKTSNNIGIWADEENRQTFLNELSKNGVIKNIELKFRLKNGRVGTGLMSATILKIKGEKCIITLTRDITERKKAEEALLASEDKFSKAFKTSPDAIAIHRLSDGMFIEINEGFTESTGYTWEEVKGKTSREINIWVNPEDRDMLSETLHRDGEIKNFECKFRLRNGETGYGLMSAKVIIVNGEKCIISITRDITARKRTEVALKESEEHLKAVTENISDGLIIIDSKGEFLYWNKAALIMHGFPEDYDLEVLKVSDIATNITTPDGVTIKQDKWPLKRIIEGEHLENTDFRIELKNTRDIRIFNYNGTSVYLANGERLSFVFIKDLTLQRKAEEEARTIEKLLNLTGEMAKVGGWEFNVATFSGTWTDEVARIHDLTPGDPTNVEIGTSFYSGEDRKRIDKAIKDVIELKIPYDLELELYTKKGNHKIIRTIGIPILEGNKVVKIRGIFQDITELKNAEAAIRENEMKLRLFIEHTPAAIAMLDKELKFVAVSARWYTDYKIKDENIIGKSQYDVFPDFPEKLKEVHLRCLAGAVEKNEEDSYLNSDGTMEWVRWEIRPWYSHTNEIGGIIVFSELITEKIKAKQALQEKAQLEEQIAKIAATAPGGLTSMRMYPDGRVVIPYASPTWEEIYNIKAEDVKEDAAPALKVVHPDDIEMVIKSLDEAKEKLETWRCEFRILNSKTGIRWVEGHSTPKLLEDGSILWHGFISDITNRKVAEQASSEKSRLEEQISRIATTAPGGIYSMKMNTDDSITFLYTSPLFEEMHGLTNEEIKNDSNTVFNRVHPEDLEGSLKSMRESALALTDWTYEFRINDPHKGIIWVEGHASPLPQPDGSILWHGFLTDVTKRKLTEAALHDSEEKLKLVVDSSEDIYIMQDIDRAYIYVSGSKKAGIVPEEFIGNKPEEIFPAEVANRINTRFKRILSTGEPVIENEHLDWHGESMWLNLRVSPVKDASGKIIGISTVVRDITEQHKAEENIRKLSLGIEQSPAIIVITDKNGNIEYTNPKFSQVTGYSAEEVIGKNPRILKSGHTTQEEYSQLWKTILEKKEWRGEFLNRKKNGELYWESAMISPLLNDKGEIVNFIALKEDITELKRITDELIKAKEKAEEMNRLKSYFFANISHELRTPFVGIIGFSEILSERLQDPGEQKMAEAILSSSKRLTETLNKILDISKLEFDKMELYTGMVNMRELIENTANLYSKTAAKKKTSILTDAASAPSEWKTDERLLREILNNLVNNAVKFTSDGEVKISVSTKEKLLIIKVSDTGVGIPEEKQEIIWQEFRQASEGYNRSFEGTGLGLSITKKYTSLLGGNISMTSKPGVGTEFTVELPELSEETAEKKRVENEEIRIQERVERQKFQHKVLYVEDDFISIEFVREVLQSEFNLDIADRPQIALNMIKENFYDAILLDINLGGHGMNGIDLLQEIKKIQEYQKVPVVAVTAYASKSDEQEFLSKGFTHYLSKPFLSRSLTDLLDRIFSRRN